MSAKYSRIISTGGDETLVTEAIQSLFVYIFEKRETCTAPQSIPAYLCVSLRHMIVNELKKENSGSLKSLDEVGTNEYQFDLEIDIETAIIHSELESENIYQALHSSVDIASKAEDALRTVKSDGNSPKDEKK